MRVGRVLFLCVFLLSASALFAQPTQQADWRQGIAGATGAALTQISNGDVVVAGIVSSSVYDANYGAVLKLQRYSATGAPVWAAPVSWVSPAAGVRPASLVSDAAGNTYVLGTIGDLNYPICLDLNPCPGSISIFNAWWLIQKYSPTGVLLWEKRQLQVGFVPVRGSVDAAGDLYVALDPNSPSRTAVVVKVAAATGATVWTASTPDGAKPGALALTPAGTLLLAGSSSLGLSINEYASVDGARLTRTLYPAAAGVYAPGMAVSPQGQIAVTGTSTAGLFLAAESSSRLPLFETSQLPGAAGRQVTFDAFGSIVVAGTVPGSAGTNWLLVRVDQTGAPLHAPVVFDRHATGAETPTGLATAVDGAAYVTGVAGPAPTSEPASMQAVTLKLSFNGTIAWVGSEATGVRGVGVVADASTAAAALAAGGMTLVHYPAPLVNQAPTSAIRVASVSGLTVGFDASGSVDSDGTIGSYRWTFGDGTTQVTSVPTVSHAYASGGTFTASVTAVDALGLAGAAASTTVSVVAPATPTSLLLSATSVRGGNRLTGRMTLSSALGAVVMVSSSNPTIASVPATVTVPAGQTSASFTISTSRVRANTSVTITVTANGVSRSAALTVLK